MLQQHKTRLISTHLAIVQHLAEIRQVAALGKSPSGSRLAPLPEPAGTELLSALDTIAAQMEELVSLFAADFRQSAQGPPGLPATKMWLSILLRTVEDLISDLSPDRMSSQYGEIEAREAVALQQKLEEIMASYRAALAIALDS